MFCFCKINDYVYNNDGSEFHDPTTWDHGIEWYFICVLYLNWLQNMTGILLNPFVYIMFQSYPVLNLTSTSRAKPHA